MICLPCRDAADAETAAGPGILGAGHPPEICRDYAVQPGGCGCQHRPVQPKEPK